MHHETTDRQTFQKTVLHRDVPCRVNYPGIDIFKTAGVITGLVSHCLTGLIGEVTVSVEVHAG